jgi:hypothetical protein
MSKNLEARLNRLERNRRSNNLPLILPDDLSNIPDNAMISVDLDVPGGRPDKVTINGKTFPVPDGRKFIAEHPGKVMKVYKGWDPDWV